MNSAAEVVDALVVQPGDTLVVRVRGDVNPAQIAETADMIRERLRPDVELLVVAAEQLAVIRST